MELDGDNKYHMITHSKGIKACPDLGGSIFVLQDANGEIVSGVALLTFPAKQKKSISKSSHTEIGRRVPTLPSTPQQKVPCRR